VVVVVVVLFVVSRAQNKRDNGGITITKLLHTTPPTRNDTITTSTSTNY
jgi:hypothetical protein